MNNEGTRPEHQLLEQLIAERAELDRHIAFLQKRLGVESESVVQPAVSVVGSGELSSIQRGEFYGLSRPQAAAALLKKVKKNLTTNQIFDALKESGYEGLAGKNAFNGLYTALIRAIEITKVAPNTWGLRDRYPHLKETRKRVPFIPNGAAGEK